MQLLGWIPYNKYLTNLKVTFANKNNSEPKTISLQPTSVTMPKYNISSNQAQTAIMNSWKKSVEFALSQLGPNPIQAQLQDIIYKKMTTEIYGYSKVGGGSKIGTSNIGTPSTNITY